MAEKSQSAADDGGAHLPPRLRPAAKLSQYLANQGSMPPFVFFNPANRVALLTVGDGLPMSAVGVRRGAFAGIGQLKNGDQLFAVVFWFGHCLRIGWASVLKITRLKSSVCGGANNR